MDYGPYLRLAHRVDQAINRDILVARKVANPAIRGADSAVVAAGSAADSDGE
jgi:hypothetical protein